MDYLVFPTRPTRIAIATTDILRIARPEDAVAMPTFDLCQLTGVSVAVSVSEAVLDSKTDARRLLLFKDQESVGMLVPASMMVESHDTDELLALPALLGSVPFSALLLKASVPHALVAQRRTLMELAWSQNHWSMSDPSTLKESPG